MIKHSLYKGRFGYVLNSHPSNNQANVALDGYVGSRIANDHSISLKYLVSVCVSGIASIQRHHESFVRV